jgi:hypothetical protein
MIDLLNRIGFRQIAFGGEGGGGGGGARGMPAASNNVVKNAALRKNIMNQPHKLAYITPQEEQMLRDAGGTGQFVNGIPAFPRGSVSKAKVDKAKTKTSTKSTPAPRDDRQPVVKSTPSYDFGSSNDDNDPPPVVYTPPPVVYTPPDPVYTYYDPDPTPTPDPVTVSPTDTSNVYDFYEPDPVTVSPTDTSNVYDFYEPDPVTVSPTDTSNVYDFYEPDPVTVYDGGSNDEETVMLQPVTYTGPAFETTLDTGDFSLDDLDLGTGVAPVDETSPFVFDADTLSQITNIRGITPPQTNWVGNNTQEASNVDPNSRFDFDPVGAYETEIIPEIIGALPKEEVVTDGTVVSSVPKPIGPTVTVSTSNASNIAEGRFEGIRDKLEALGYTVSANGSSVYTADGQVAGENWSGSSKISNMLKENQDQNGALASINNNPTATTPFNTQTFGALPDGVTQQMITDSQNDGEYGYYNNDGSYVPKEIDKYNGGGPDYSGVAFASGGGAQFDLDGDRFLSKTEMGIGKAAGYELDQNFWSKAGTGLGVTPLGSGQDPTGVAKWAEKLIVPGGSTIRKLSPPAFERPLSSYDPNNPYADVGEDAPNIWWEKGKTNPLGFEYKRTPDEVLADRTESREKAAIAAANELTNNDNDSGPRTRREDLFGTRMTTEEYRRRYKGGGGAALPAYMRKYASGKSIDELVRKVKVNGKDYFLTPDGRYIEPSAFTGAAASRDLDVVETGEEQYLEGYNVIDESTGIITTYNTDGSIMEVFDPNFESEEA